MLTLYSMEAIASSKAVFPALRMTKSSPGVVEDPAWRNSRVSTSEHSGPRMLLFDQSLWRVEAAVVV